MRDPLADKKRDWPSAVVFDLDGTLVDSAGDIACSLNQLLAVRRLAPFALEEVIGFIGDGISTLIKRALSARGRQLEPDELFCLLEEFRNIYGGRLTKLTRTYVGVADLLSGLSSSGVALGVCTNKEQHLAEAVIDGLRLRDKFPVVVGGLPDRPRKPSPLPLLETLARLGAMPQDAIMVGDSAADVDCARSAAVAFLGVSFGYSRPPIASLGARVIIDSYFEFAAACDALRDARR